MPATGARERSTVVETRARVKSAGRPSAGVVVEEPRPPARRSSVPPCRLAGAGGTLPLSGKGRVFRASSAV
ncbi:hypothetical protein ACWGAN_15595 [Streptomyces sp. NPDC054945]